MFSINHQWPQNLLDAVISVFNPNTGKHGPEKTPSVFGHFSRSVNVKLFYTKALDYRYLGSEGIVLFHRISLVKIIASKKNSYHILTFFSTSYDFLLLTSYDI